MTHTVASLTVNTLIENGIDTLYCVPGVQNDQFFDALYHRRIEINAVQARHEQGAVYMALGAALATGKPQVFSVVPGPGFLNGTAALCTAQSLNVPLFGVVGQIPSGAVGKGLGLLHEINDQAGIMQRLTKHASSIVDPASAQSLLHGLWQQMVSGRQGPVCAEIPVDLWTKRVEALPSKRIESLRAPQVNAAQVQQAAELISAARHPIIVVGSGAQGHATLIRSFAESIDAGVVACRTGHGVMNADSDLCLSNPAAHRLWSQCDLVLGLGTRMFNQKKLWGTDAALKVVHIDIDKEVLSRVCKPTVGIHADLADVLPLLIDHVNASGNSEWRQQIVKTKSVVKTEIENKLLPQLEWLSAIRDVLPREGILVDELTQIGFVARFAFPCFEPRTFLSTGYQGTLGWGIASALGAAHARRDVPVVSIAGDGGALFTISELATAVHHNIPLTVIVMNDHAYGNVRGIQRDDYDGRYIASDLSSPDFVALAKSFGVTAERAETPDDLRSCLQRAIAHKGPNLIEVPVSDFPSPWEFIQLPAVRGVQG